MEKQCAAAGPNPVFGFRFDHDRAQAERVCDDRGGEADGSRADDRNVRYVVARVERGGWQDTGSCRSPKSVFLWRASEAGTFARPLDPPCGRLAVGRWYNG
jgi:hypothetical protein